ncbi:MAG TPA: hypothetical protein PKG95_15490 [Anaerolineaceae bacterium]|nr:hypothetical protein [Anaerolineaceae bacterium]
MIACQHSPFDLGQWGITASHQFGDFIDSADLAWLNLTAKQMVQRQHGVGFTAAKISLKFYNRVAAGSV